MEVVPFRRGDARDLWDRLQAALNAKSDGNAVIAARGTGCAAALALAEQLPVERVALIEPALSPPRGGGTDAALRRVARRMGRFAVRNLPLCAADLLVAARGDAPLMRALRPGALWPRARLVRLRIPADCDDNMLKNRENMVNRAIYCFLRTGELPKPLAKNAEMCIIDG